MNKLALSGLAWIWAASAWAVEAVEEPMEKASPWIVALFLLLFMGGCALFVWLTAKKAKDRRAERDGTGQIPPP